LSFEITALVDAPFGVPPPEACEMSSVAGDAAEWTDAGWAPAAVATRTASEAAATTAERRLARFEGRSGARIGGRH
jgi:hypothetical protein